MTELYLPDPTDYGVAPCFAGIDAVQFSSVLEAALEYHRRGFSVTPLFEKRPIHKGWQARKLTEAELPRSFTEGRNLGIVLGGPARIVDVDLDNPVAVAVAELLLPDTVKSGRARSLRLHRWYLCDRAPNPRKYVLTNPMVARLMVEPGEGTLVELRSTGQQTMVPPSIHPVDGDPCFWHPGEICEIDGQELAGLVRDVAIAAVLALNRPLGSREWFATRAAGYLSPRVGLERTTAILGVASAAFDDEEHDERMRAVRAFLREPICDDRTIDAALAAELERLAPGVPERISRWCDRGRRGVNRFGRSYAPIRHNLPFQRAMYEAGRMNDC